MKTNKLPSSVRTDLQAAGSQSQPVNQSNTRHLASNNAQQTELASNDGIYDSEILHRSEKDDATLEISSSTIDCGYKKSVQTTKTLSSTARPVSEDIEAPPNTFHSDTKHLSAVEHSNSTKYITDKQAAINNATESNTSQQSSINGMPNSNIPERVFMNSLVKHTGIALAIIIPLAAFSAYAAPSVNPVNTTLTKTASATIAIEPDAIIHKSADTPTTVDRVNLERYAGTWYEIGRLPMYFQRNCARDVTATYTGNTNGSGITVLNKCTDVDGNGIMAEGLAKPADDTGSKLRVTFLPSWIRWLPVGRADYWVLARDADYKTALVGTPDKDYLWLLARSPNITQQTYAKYRQIAQQQGYDLKEFKLTAQNDQTVNLIP